MASQEPKRAEMWGVYEYRGHRVTVLQQWQDPFGCRMVRIQLAADGEAAAGIPEADFLREARAMPDAGGQRRLPVTPRSS